MASEEQRTITGIGVCPGKVVGPVVLLLEPLAEPSPGVRLSPSADLRAEADRIPVAAAQVQADLERADRKSVV